MTLKNTIIHTSGYFGPFGGRYVSEPLIPVIDEVRDGFFRFSKDPLFLEELRFLYRSYIGRPSPLVECVNLSKKFGKGARLFVKNEGCNHTGAHKINNVVGQVLLAKHLGKKRIIAETGAGQHGIATASVCAKLGLECVIYMGAKDYIRQRPNVYAMELAGAKVCAVEEGDQTLRSAINAAMRDLLNNAQESYYLLGTACGPHPYPSMNVFFQKIIGEELRLQLQESCGRDPDVLLACVGGGSNSLGLFYEFLDDPSVRLIGIEAGGTSQNLGCHAARFSQKKIGINQGFRSYFLQNNSGQIAETASISAGLDYSGVSPQIAYLESIDRVEISSVYDDRALEALQYMMQYEGLLPALESAHAMAHALSILPELEEGSIVVVNMSGRGEKDLFITADHFDPKWKSFLHKQLQEEGEISGHDLIEPKGLIDEEPRSSLSLPEVQDLAGESPPLMTHLVAGYPDFEESRSIFQLLSHFSRYIEIQIPFSDPVADGPIIAQANERALRGGVTTEGVFDFISSLQFGSARILVMTYFQVVYAYGMDAFFARAQSLGISGCIIPDVPYDSPDGSELLRLSLVYGVFLVPIVAKNTTKERLAVFSQTASPIVYALSGQMTTGSSLRIDAGFHSYIAGLRKYFSQEIYVGFGIKTRDDVQSVTSCADGAVIGSQILCEYRARGIRGVETYFQQLSIL